MCGKQKINQSFKVYERQSCYLIIMIMVNQGLNGLYTAAFAQRSLAVTSYIAVAFPFLT